MAMTVREAFEKGTDTFNAHDLDGFTSVLADDAVFRAPGGMTGQGKTACTQFYAAGSAPSPTRTSRSTTSTSLETSPSRKAPSPEPTRVSCTARPVISRLPAAPVALDYIHVLRYRDGLHVSFNLMFDRLLMLEQLGLIPAPAPTS